MSIIPTYNFKANDLIKSSRTTQSKVDEIRKWLDHNRNIPQLSDEQIILFLLSCNNEVDYTIVTIKAFYKHKKNSAELFVGRDAYDKEFVENFKTGEMAAFPKHTKENYAIIFSRLRDTNYYKFNVDQQIKHLFMCLDVILYTNPPDGLIAMFDMKGIGLMHLTRLKLGVIRKFFSYLQEALPCQLKQIHIMNCTYLFDKILMICKPFMKKELINMIMTHPTNLVLSEFHEKYVPAECLPVDFGGELPSIAELNEELFRNYKNMRKFFELEQKQAEQYKQI